jgi:hypothetical protein
MDFGHVLLVLETLSALFILLIFVNCARLLRIEVAPSHLSTKHAEPVAETVVYNASHAVLISDMRRYAVSLASP